MIRPEYPPLSPLHPPLTEEFFCNEIRAPIDRAGGRQFAALPRIFAIDPEPPVVTVALRQQKYAIAPSGDAEKSRRLVSVDVAYLSQLPAGSDEMTGVAVGIPFQVVLMLGFRLPKIAGRCNLSHNLAWP